MTVLRRWSSLIRTSDEGAYAEFLRTRVLGDYAAIGANLGVDVLMRSLVNGMSEITMLSRWTSIEAIAALSDSEFEISRHHGTDARFLLDKPRCVELHRIVASLPELPATPPTAEHRANNVNY